jgi:predicted peroxiredoxin
MDQARDLGVRFYVCQPSLDLNDLKMEDLIDGVEMIGGAAFNDLARVRPCHLLLTWRR